MAYLKIFSDSDGRQIGEMRIIDNQNDIFDMQGNKVGFCVVTDCGEKYFDVAGHAVEKIEDLFLHE